ncbi:hypothetical protein [Sulfitobacter sp. SK012]|uniref:hypothetical protein n=1 Tax=Sulfitobacter sp. SK012 TaxID=1389005 RepID=UPI0013B4364E|nr:hypothetical protein [Sulfitobacter sp. SK012]
MSAVFWGSLAAVSNQYVGGTIMTSVAAYVIFGHLGMLMMISLTYKANTNFMRRR